MYPSPPKGFTLLELLVVIVIVAVLASLMVPSLAGNSGRDAEDSAHRMVLLINQAQQEAVLSSRIWQVVFDPAVDSYHFGRRAGSDFEAVSLMPFAGEHVLPTVSLGQLEINGESMSETAEVYLFPTGEQDAFRLTVSGGDRVYGVVMGPVGLARLEQL